MPQEIERKFLISRLPVEILKQGLEIVQGYIVNQKEKVIRVRIAGEKAFLTLKSKTVNGIRNEYEYEIPVMDARELLTQFCNKPWVEKIRFKIEYKNFVWEIDRFSGANDGLILAEIELDDIDQPFEKPDWIGPEVTHDPRYYNSNLIAHPFTTWEKD